MLEVMVDGKGRKETCRRNEGERKDFRYLENPALERGHRGKKPTRERESRKS